MFKNSLSDTPNIAPCKTTEDQEIIIPEKYDWREQYPECVKPVLNSGNCSSSYAVTTLSVVTDRICQQTKQPFNLSAQELIDCDKGSYGCDGGYVTRVLSWGKRKGFLPESCYPYTGVKGTCPEDHLESNECRVHNNFYKVIDFCIAQDEKNIKKEIIKNGPVIS